MGQFTTSVLLKGSSSLRASAHATNKDATNLLLRGDRYSLSAICFVGFPGEREREKEKEGEKILQILFYRAIYTIFVFLRGKGRREREREREIKGGRKRGGRYLFISGGCWRRRVVVEEVIRAMMEEEENACKGIFNGDGEDK